MLSRNDIHFRKRGIHFKVFGLRHRVTTCAGLFRKISLYTCCPGMIVQHLLSLLKVSHFRQESIQSSYLCTTSVIGTSQIAQNSDPISLLYYFQVIPFGNSRSYQSMPTTTNGCSLSALSPLSLCTFFLVSWSHPQAFYSTRIFHSVFSTCKINQD